jgi:formate-nitrite transporter family protein
MASAEGRSSPASQEEASSRGRGDHRRGRAEARDDPGAPFKPHRLIFEQESHQAVDELERPAVSLATSGVLAGFGVGLGIMIAAIVLQHAGDDRHGLLVRLLVANVYTLGFIAVIMARSDLFTEYSTIAIFPVLTGKAKVSALMRLWLIIYLANLAGAAAFAALLMVLGPALGFAELGTLALLADNLLGHAPWIVLLSASLSGWLMGLLSWLLVAARDTTSQIFFIWLIVFVITFAHLHHSISGAVTGLTAFFAQGWHAAPEIGRVALWTTLGNALGGIIFAVMVRYSVLLRHPDDAQRS